MNIRTFINLIQLPVISGRRPRAATPSFLPLTPLTFIFLFVLLIPLMSRAGDGTGHMARKMWEELKLTTEQNAELKGINTKYAPARRDRTQRMAELQVRINQELLKDRPSKSLLAQLAGQMGEIQKQMNIASVNHLFDVKAVLTPEQFKIFIEQASISNESSGERRRAEGRTGGENNVGE